MGFEDRHYTREDSMFGSNKTGLAQYSIVAILIAINFIVWVLDTFSPRIEPMVPIHWVNFMLALNVDQPWRIWTFLTYGFCHSSIESNPFHIMFNMFVLFMFGRPVSQRLGRYEFLRFYLTAIFVSGLAYFIWSIVAASRGSVVGASGATTAVVILFILWYPNQQLSLMGILDVPAWVLGTILVAYDLLRALTSGSGEGSNVAWQAHLAGAGFAFLYFKNQWHFGWMTSLTAWIPERKNKFSVYDPDANDKQTDQLSSEGDRILAKISEQGEESLTRKERKTLERYSKSIRNRK